MNLEPELNCPKCGKQMEVLKPPGAIELPSNLLRVCPFCVTLAWTNEDGTVETTPPHDVK